MAFRVLHTKTLCLIRRGMTISIIGIGRLGGALALALAEKGFEIENLFVRKRATAERIAVLRVQKFCPVMC